MSNDFIVNSFQLPNAVVDKLLIDLSGSELKCYLVIVRQTKGWQKSEDAISISQFMGKTGLSNRVIIDACKSLEKYGLIESKKGYRNTTVYMCKNFTSEEKSHVKKTTATCEENDTPPVKKSHTQKTLIQNTLNTKDTSEPFECWYEIYPRKINKKKAAQAWKKLKLDSRVEELIEKLTQQNAMQYAFTQKDYIPYPASYLNAEAWDNEIEYKNPNLIGGNHAGTQHTPKPSLLDRVYDNCEQAERDITPVNGPPEENSQQILVQDDGVLDGQVDP